MSKLDGFCRECYKFRVREVYQTSRTLSGIDHER